MLRNILYEITLFSPGEDPAEGRRDLGWFLEALTQRNQDYLKHHPDTPLLYKSGVKYMNPAQTMGECEEVGILRAALGSQANIPGVPDVLDRIQGVFGGERFRDIGRIIENGGGDCDNVSCWRVAELRQHGIKAYPYLKWRTRPGGGVTYHALVLWPDNTDEDPSLLLGMGGPDRAADRAREIQKNAERVQMVREAVARRSKKGEVQTAVESILGLLGEGAL